MRRSPDAIVAAARAMLGVRFRPQGRSRDAGLDCVGLVAVALGADEVPRDYALRGAGAPERIAATLSARSLRREDVARPGDVLVMAAAPAQTHLGIFTGAGLVHGDAGLRRVVERPGPMPWPVIQIWRLRED